MTETITRTKLPALVVAPQPVSQQLAVVLSESPVVAFKDADIKDKLSNPAARARYVALINNYPDQDRAAVTYGLQDVRSNREMFAALEGRAAEVCSRTSTTVAASTAVGSLLLQFSATPPSLVVFGISIAASLLTYGAGEFLSQRWFGRKLRAENEVTIVKEVLGQIRPPAIAPALPVSPPPTGAAQ